MPEKKQKKTVAEWAVELRSDFSGAQFADPVSGEQVDLVQGATFECRDKAAQTRLLAEHSFLKAASS